MEMKLISQARDTTTTNNSALRDADMIPAVYYGNDKGTTSITVPRQEFITLYKEAGQSTIINLTTPEGDQQAIIQDIQVHPVTQKLLHVDFFLVNANEVIRVEVPLEFEGMAPAEDQGLGVLNKAIQVIEIEVLPADLPQSLSVDLSSLNTLDDNIYVKDIALPPSAKLITGEGVIVATVSEIKEEVEEEVTEIDMAAIASDEKNDGKEEEAPAEE